MAKLVRSVMAYGVKHLFKTGKTTLYMTHT